MPSQNSAMEMRNSNACSSRVSWTRAQMMFDIEKIDKLLKNSFQELLDRSL
jgi:hypothetical protein